MWFHRLTRLSWAVACLGACSAIIGCGIDRSGLSAGSTGGGGGAAVGSGGTAIAGGGGSGSGGSGAGSGGGAPAGTGGAPVGSGGSDPGTGGLASGTGGEDTGSGGAVAGSGGAMPGTGGVFVDPGTGGGEAGTGGGGGNDVTPELLGCADGTREAFADPARFPAIAGCAGAWSVPGLVTAASRAPACGRAAGNDAGNTTGAGCTVEDLCADGWRVCAGARELAALGVTCADAGIPAASAGAGGPLFFATRQRGTPPTSCSPDEATTSNNLHGCGNFGRAEDAGCAPPLNRQIENTACAANPPWACSESAGIMSEATVVTKSGPSGGGVLCCRQPS
jgi:hypothetical protein